MGLKFLWNRISMSINLQFHEKLCFYFCYSRKFLVKSSITIFKYDFRIGLIPIVHGLFHLWNHGLVAFIKIILAFVLYLCLILNQIIIMPEPNSSNGWKMGMTSSMYITCIFYFPKGNNLHICIQRVLALCDFWDLEKVALAKKNRISQIFT